jgi:hypothetical protein
LLAGFVILVATAARAGDFPVTAAYGTASACAAFAQGGVQAVEAGQDVDAVLITPKELAAAGLSCAAEKAHVKGISVTAECVLAGGEPFHSLRELRRA